MCSREMKDYFHGGVVVNKQEKDIAVPVWQKSLLTLEEAAAYTGIGANRLRQMSEAKNCDFVIWVGCRRMLKREKLNDYLLKSFSV